MKLVLCYTTSGGYECDPYDNIICLEYESKELLITAFEYSCLLAKESHEKWLECSRKRPGPLHTLPTGSKEWNKTKHLQDEWQFKLWQIKVHEVVFDGHKFGYLDFFKGKEKIYHAPEIYELNEWWESKSQEKHESY